MLPVGPCILFQGQNQSIQARIKGGVEKRSSGLKGSAEKKGKESGLKNLVKWSSRWGVSQRERVFPGESHSPSLTLDDSETIALSAKRMQSWEIGGL